MHLPSLVPVHRVTLKMFALLNVSLSLPAAPLGPSHPSSIYRLIPRKAEPQWGRGEAGTWHKYGDNHNYMMGLKVET